MLSLNFNKRKFCYSLKKIGLFLLFLGIFVSGILMPFSAVFAQDLTNGMGEFQSQTGLGGVDLITVIGRIVNIFLSFLGLIGVILVIYAGFIWMTSGGSPEQIS